MVHPSQTRLLAFLGGSVGPGELVFIFVVVLVLFGPRRLPEMARTLGKALAELRKASSDFKDQVMRIEEQPGGGGSTASTSIDRSSGSPPVEPQQNPEGSGVPPSLTPPRGDADHDLVG